ncbi:MAG: cell division protein ZapA [Clostridia bacterium]|nr:cell division protein ZapA [Clostridia bacterium]
MDRQTINVLVAGKNYTLTSSDSPEYVRRVAAFVDRRLSETAAATNLSSAQGAVLTCFQLADELLKAQDENRMLRRRMENTDRKA